MFTICLNLPFLSSSCFLLFTEVTMTKFLLKYPISSRLSIEKYITSHCFGLNFGQFDTRKDVRPVENVFTAGGLAISKPYEQQI